MNKSLPAEKQMVTANPEINTVCNPLVDMLPLGDIFLILFLFFVLIYLFIYLNQASLCNDDDFMVLACDGIW